MKSGPGYRGRSAFGTTHVGCLELPHETGLILKCAAKVMKLFQTKQRNRPSCGDQEGHPNFWCVKLVGQLVGLCLIPVLYYTYTGILGVEADWFNIAIFFLAAGLGFYLETKLLQKGTACRISPKVAVAALLTIAVLFTVFTFHPPKIPFFRDPVTGSYGFRRG